MQRRLPLAVVVTAAVVLLFSAFAGAAPGGSAATSGSGHASDGAKPAAGVDTDLALVELAGAPIATRGQSDNRAQRAELAAIRNGFKAWLRDNARAARVTREFDTGLNAVGVRLNGTPLDTIRRAPNVVAAELQAIYRPLAAVRSTTTAALAAGTADPDLSLINWGPSDAGAGVKVAVVDTGIEATHPCFVEDGKSRVTFAGVYNMRAKQQGLTPAAVQEHGTHVAGTIACDANTPAVVDDVEIPYGVSGVAPKAELGNFNVFPGHVEDARSEDILDALQAAFAWGADVANMSLGGGASGKQDLLTKAVVNLDKAGMVVAVAAGNSGPGHYTVESPGSSSSSLSAGASTVPHFVGVLINQARAATGDFATVTTPLTASLNLVQKDGKLDLGCTTLPEDVTGQIAVVSRGSCTFTVKVRNAQAAKAAAVVIVNNVAGDPIAMGTDGTPDQPTLPAYMIGKGDLGALGADGASATIPVDKTYFLTDNENIMAGFSSQGPTDVDFRIKPDVVAPGVNVLSSVPGGKFAFYQGTSMATPHLAGTAAALLSMHPAWTPAQVRSAIVNTANRNALTKSSDGVTPETDVNVIGSGLEDVTAAAGATVALDPVSISFGAIPAGSGQTVSRQLTLTNLTATATSYTLSIASSSSGFGTQSAVSVPAGGSATITISFTSVKGATAGGTQGWLVVSDGTTEVAHAALYALIK